MRFWSSNVINFPAWQTDFSFGTQPQGTGDMKISNCHVYGLADMTVPVHGTYVFEKGEVSRTTAHSYWGAAGEGCVWLLMVITRDIQHFTTHSNLESGLLVNCLRDQLSHWNHGSDFWGNTQYIIISTLQGVSLCEERYWFCENEIRIENNLLSEYM